ncbi:MAG: hypothetical protein HXY24_11830, partial [Rubrivivax sp.]|nr:hypothetical protein [Rubrivivax sp.]
GKYDEYGNRRTLDVARLAMPLQKIETVDEPRQRLEGQNLAVDFDSTHHDDFRNAHIAHSEAPLQDQPAALTALQTWLSALVALHTALTT